MSGDSGDNKADNEADSKAPGASNDSSSAVSPMTAARLERQLVKRAESLLDALRKTDPEYFDFMEDANPMLATRADLRRLMERAPNDSVFMYVFANFSTRLELAAVTGREFV